MNGEDKTNSATQKNFSSELRFKAMVDAVVNCTADNRFGIDWKTGNISVLSKKLRRIPLKVRAIGAKINYLKSTHSTATFGILSKTTHFSSFLQVTPRLNSQAFSRNLKSKIVRMLKACVIVLLTEAKCLF